MHRQGKTVQTNACWQNLRGSGWSQRNERTEIFRPQTRTKTVTVSSFLVFTETDVAWVLREVVSVSTRVALLLKWQKLREQKNDNFQNGCLKVRQRTSCELMPFTLEPVSNRNFWREGGGVAHRFQDFFVWSTEAGGQDKFSFLWIESSSLIRVKEQFLQTHIDIQPAFGTIHRPAIWCRASMKTLVLLVFANETFPLDNAKFSQERIGLPNLKQKDECQIGAPLRSWTRVFCWSSLVTCDFAGVHWDSTPWFSCIFNNARWMRGWGVRKLSCFGFREHKCQESVVERDTSCPFHADRRSRSVEGRTDKFHQTKDTFSKAKVASVWKKRSDFKTSSSCCLAFLRISRRRCRKWDRRFFVMSLYKYRILFFSLWKCETKALETIAFLLCALFEVSSNRDCDCWEAPIVTRFHDVIDAIVVQSLSSTIVTGIFPPSRYTAILSRAQCCSRSCHRFKCLCQIGREIWPLGRRKCKWLFWDVECRNQSESGPPRRAVVRRPELCPL